MSVRINRFLALFVALAASVFSEGQASGASPGGALVVVGGGEIGPAIIERFVELAGGKDAEIVAIPTAHDVSDAGERLAKSLRETFGFERITILHTKDRAEADSEEFVAPLRSATAVWIGGGRQWRLVDSYLGTRTEREIKAMLERGGVVGGSSAGATIQGSFLVRGAREGNWIMVAKDYTQGLGLMDGVAIDQHILPRGRAGDLSPVIDAHPELLGLGVDESTAMVVEGDRFEVIGRGVVAVHDGRDHDGRKYYFLAPGEQFDWKARRRVEADNIRK